MQQLGERLVGRDTELAVIERALAELADGRPAALEVTGEPGIGKTRLLAELGERATARGHIVLTGSASELEIDVPFWVFVDALDDYVRGLEASYLEALPAAVLAELATIFPALGRYASGHEVAVQHERYRSHRAVRDLLESIASRRPLVLVLDDVHWADAGSVELLSTLLRRPPTGPAMIALGVRTRQRPGRLAIAISRALRDGTIGQVELSPLTAEQARDLLAAAGVSLHRSDIYEESGGNPFYLEQLARAFASTAPIHTHNADMSWLGAQLPGSVAAALSQELAILSRSARTVLESAAIAGDPFDLELAAAAGAIDDASALDGMDELLGLDLVRATETPRRFRFRHPLLRRAAYEASPAGWRIAAHGRCAEALRRLGAPASVQAHHVDNSARRGDLSAVAVLREAAQEATARSPATAARWFAAALRLIGDAGTEAERVAMLTALAGTQAATGQFDAARAAFIEAMGRLPANALSERVGLTAACAGVEQLLGHHEAAHARLVTALEDLQDVRSPEAAALLISLAQDAFYQSRNAESRGWGLRVLDIARPLDDAALVACATSFVALGAAFEGNTEEAERYRYEAAGLLDAMSDAEAAVRLDALAYLSGAEAYLDHFDECITHATRGLAIARATHQDALLPMLTQSVATARLARGQLPEAAEVLDGSIEGARLAGNEGTLAWSLLNRAYIAAQMGDLDIAVAAGTESVELTRHAKDTPVATWAGAIMGIVRLAEGDHERAADLFTTCAGGEAMPRIPGGWRANYLELLTRSYLLGDRPDLAARAAAHSSAVAERTGLRTARGWALRAAGALALHTGDPSTALERALASVACFDEVGSAINGAQSRIVAGRALIQLGDIERAKAYLETAMQALDDHHAVRMRHEVERDLRRLGVPVHRRSTPATGTGLKSLTGRERELADLIVRRKTNAEIAATLFLSKKTVETHVSNIFRKMKVNSRAELALVVERARIADRGSD